VIRRAVVLAVVSTLLPAAIACGTASCPPGSRRSDVIPLNGGNRSPGFVCLPQDDDTATAAPPAAPTATTPPPFGEQADAAAAPPVVAGRSDAAAPLPDACSVGSPGDLDVHFVARSGAPPAPAGTPPDAASYILVQATFWATGAAASAVADARAEVAVEGGLLVLTIETAGANVEGATLTLAGGFMTTVCRTAPGPATAAILPPVGASARATAGWDGRSLDLVVEHDGGAFELVFAPPG
jgi:hypothetical protein